MLKTGTILQNRYRIDKQIGQGGMGKVYVATDERVNSTVAIKETVFEDSGLRQAFEREARLLNSLKHTALPRVSDHFNEADGQFLVMEYIAGEDLAEMMEQSGEAFPLGEVLNWANQLCDALDYLHAQNIIHRDIKPQNLKLTPSEKIALLDFGLAKGNPTDARHQTAAKSIFGYSRSYASLEQIQGTGTEPRSDLYSLSATLYHLLTGIPPADALTRAMNVLNGKPDPLIPAHLVNKQVPRGISEVLQKAMALNAAERPNSAPAMRSQLDASNKSLSAEQISTGSLVMSDILTQETKIMAATTSAGQKAESEVKTEIAPDDRFGNDSYKTQVGHADDLSNTAKIRSATQNTDSPKRLWTVGAAIFGLLLLIGTALSAAYFYNADSPATNSAGSSADIELKENILAAADDANTANNGSTSETAEIPTGNSSAANIDARPNTVPADEELKKTGEIFKKPTGKNQVAERSKQPKLGDDEVIINEKNDSIETKDMIIDENGIRMKNKKHPAPSMSGNYSMPVPPQVIKKMTGEQLLKLRQMQKEKKQFVFVKPEKTKPSPVPPATPQP